MSRMLNITRLLTGLTYPSGLCFDPVNHNLYICNLHEKTIVQYSERNGKILALRGDFSRPLALTLDELGRLLVADAGRNALFRLENGRWNELKIRSAKEIRFLGSVTCDDQGTIYFTDFLSHAIYWLDEDYHAHAIEEIQCAKPYGIHWKMGVLYVTDTGNEQILCYRREDKSVNPICAGLGITPIAVACGDGADVYFSEVRKLYRYEPGSEKPTLLLSRSNWDNDAFDALCHIGALMVLPDQRIVFSDTIKHCVYEMRVDGERRIA